MRAAVVNKLRFAATRGAASRARAATSTSLRIQGSSAVPVRTFASAASAGSVLTELSKDNPHVDVVRYEHKNRKWTMRHVEFYSEALAIGFAETGLRPGDALLCWLPLHFSETMVLQFACSKAGFVFYHLDPSVAKTNPDKAKKILDKALTISEANILISQEAQDDVSYINLVEDLIPDLDVFDFATGQPFVCPQYPHLRFPIHTGFDQIQKWGWLPLKHMVVPSENLDRHLEGYELTGKTPLLGQFQFDSSGVPTAKGDTLTNEQVLQKNVWPTFSNILNKEFHDVDGVGVVW